MKRKVLACAACLLVGGLAQFPDQTIGISQLSMVAAAQSGVSSPDQMREEAAILARNQQFDQSLSLLRSLLETDPDNKAVLFDYITVLNWAGHNQATIELYESHAALPYPQYARFSIGGAYFQQQQYRQALAMYHTLAAEGHRQAKIMEAETLVRLGDFHKADSLYLELLQDSQPPLSVLLSRASSMVFRGEHAAAVSDFSEAKTLIPPGDAGRSLRLSVEDLMTAALINAGQPDRAIEILKPYIENQTANLSMQGNYILALSIEQRYNEAIQAAKLLWPSYDNAPIFGLRTLAESFVHVGDYPAALAIYEHILFREPGDRDASLGQSFNMLLSGQAAQGMELYSKILRNDPGLAVRAVEQAEMLYTLGKDKTAQKLFQTIINALPFDALPLIRGANELSAHGQERAAVVLYLRAAEIPAGEAEGLAGTIRTALRLEDYRLAESTLTRLEAKYPYHPLIAGAVQQDKVKRMGESEIRTVYNDSYKQIKSSEITTTAEQYLSGGYWLTTELGRTRLDDYGAGQRQVLYSRSLGLKYLDRKWDMRLNGTQGFNGPQFSGYSFSATYQPKGEYRLAGGITRGPVLDAQALDPANGGPVSNLTYWLSWHRYLDQTSNLGATLSRSLFTDGNRSRGFDLDYERIFHDDGEYAAVGTLFWRRNYNFLQGLVYESPSLREAFGAVWQLKHTIPSGYWLGRTVFAWSHDDPDPIGFEPSFRLEYGHDFAPNRTLVAGMEYGLHTTVGSSRSLHYGYRQYDLLYRYTW